MYTREYYLIVTIKRYSTIILFAPLVTLEMHYTFKISKQIPKIHISYRISWFHHVYKRALPNSSHKKILLKKLREEWFVWLVILSTIKYSIEAEYLLDTIDGQ